MLDGAHTPSARRLRAALPRLAGCGFSGWPEERSWRSPGGFGGDPERALSVKAKTPGNPRQRRHIVDTLVGWRASRALDAPEPRKVELGSR